MEVVSPARLGKFPDDKCAPVVAPVKQEQYPWSMKLERREIAVLVLTLVVIVTLNAWWRVKETGRRARIVAEREARQVASSGAAPSQGSAP